MHVYRLQLRYKHCFTHTSLITVSNHLIASCAETSLTNGSLLSHVVVANARALFHCSRKVGHVHNRLSTSRTMEKDPCVCCHHVAQKSLITLYTDHEMFSHGYLLHQSIISVYNFCALDVQERKLCNLISNCQVIH